MLSETEVQMLSEHAHWVIVWAFWAAAFGWGNLCNLLDTCGTSSTDQYKIGKQLELFSGLNMVHFFVQKYLLITVYIDIVMANWIDLWVVVLDIVEERLQILAYILVLGLSTADSAPHGCVK